MHAAAEAGQLAAVVDGGVAVELRRAERAGDASEDVALVAQVEPRGHATAFARSADQPRMRSLPASHARLVSSTAAGPLSRRSTRPFAVKDTPPPVSFASTSSGTRSRSVMKGSPLVASSVQRVASTSNAPRHR